MASRSRSRSRFERSVAVLAACGLHGALFLALSLSPAAGNLVTSSAGDGFAMQVGLVRSSGSATPLEAAPTPHLSELDLLNRQLTQPEVQPHAMPAAKSDGDSLLAQMSALATPTQAHAASSAASPSKPAAHLPGRPASGLAGQDAYNPWAHASLMANASGGGKILAQIQPCWAATRSHYPLQVRLTLDAQGQPANLTPISSVGSDAAMLHSAIRAIRACGPYPTPGSEAVYSLLLPAAG
jgi:hypothetical protein